MAVLRFGRGCAVGWPRVNTCLGVLFGRKLRLGNDVNSSKPLPSLEPPV